MSGAIPTPEQQATLPAIPPPHGQTSNFVNPTSRLHGSIALHTVCLFFATLFIAVRLYTRIRITKEVGLDDYVLIFAYMLTVTFSGILLAGAVHGIGIHMWDIPMVELWVALKMLTISEYIYMILVPSIKVSVLLFYYKIFRRRRYMRVATYGGIVAVIVLYLIMFFLTVFNCVPVEKGWYPFLAGKCFTGKILPYYSGALNVVTDLYVLFLPIPCIWGLNLDNGRRIRLLAIFGLAIFACAASVTRLGMTSVLYTTTDRTWVLSEIIIWSVLEVNIGIMCACALTFPAFLDRYGSNLSILSRSSRSSREHVVSSETTQQQSSHKPFWKASVVSSTLETSSNHSHEGVRSTEA